MAERFLNFLKAERQLYRNMFLKARNLLKQCFWSFMKAVFVFRKTCLWRLTVLSKHVFLRLWGPENCSSKFLKAVFVFKTCSWRPNAFSRHVSEGSFFSKHVSEGWQLYRNMFLKARNLLKQYLSVLDTCFWSLFLFSNHVSEGWQFYRFWGPAEDCSSNI